MIWKISMHEVSMMGLGLSSVCCGVTGILKLGGNISDVIEWEVMSLNSSNIVFTVILDWVSMFFLCFVFLISSSVMFYSGSYMSGDKTYNRFMYLVLMFVLSMMMMVLSPNLISILLGWDGLGLVSYALVIFYQNEKSSNAGMLTILSNRIGDVAILLSIGIMSSLGGWNFFIYSLYMGEDWVMFNFFLVIAAMTKSAQIPFSAWLPAAMAAPTPVSALVHSSTLVTAGVYLMIRFLPALVDSSVQSVLLIISCLTMFMAGLGANFEYDLKKIIALSTLSQLGVMLSILSLGYVELAFFHLLSHALFKALLFMCAGAVIHSVGDYQDIRFMGGLVSYMPLSVSYMTVANLALCGFPFLAGFYSKDLILEVAFMSWINYISFILYVLSTGLTVMYTGRLIYYSLSGGFKLSVLNSVSDNDYIMGNSMIFLGLGAVFGGSLLSWLIFPDPIMICLSSVMKSLVMVISIMGGVVGYMFNMLAATNNLNSMKVYNFVVLAGSMWFLPFLSSYNNSKISLLTGGNLQKMSDKGWYEYFGSQGVYSLLSKGFFMFYSIQTMNSVKIYMKMFFISVVIVLLVYV
uniref:NADH-ubiquinone oxidoreductase chain 5 n=1 Tax=Echinoecus nipponicus TaxID=2305783 RepID=A0A346Q1A9_9EUCA|nr:NADH dehydrogenase subunit 5 [Echinoecus nipponicus]AXR86894.1 NADH dehydrogenase subunit 5 [Echinoecus nipponicus]